MIAKNFEKPTILIDKAQVLRNFERMTNKAKKSGIILRPHLKTHQSHQIAEWMKPFGITQITVSSLYMAEYFLHHGWTDITVAIPINIHQIDQINALASQCSLHVLVENTLSADNLVKKVNAPLNVWIEIDVGDHRTGVSFDDHKKLRSLLGILKLNPVLTFTGILSHAGQTYHVTTEKEIMQIYYDSTEKMKATQEFLFSLGYENVQISVGDTPTCSVAKEFDPRITEIRPGNFFFYDISQCSYQSCSESEIAMVIACPVISKNLDNNQVVIYGGGIHLSKEHVSYHGGKPIYGLIARFNEDRSGRTEVIPDAYIFSLSQEHGRITGPKEFIEACQIGDTLLILPVHSCMVANLHTYYYTYQGEKIESFRLE